MRQHAQLEVGFTGPAAVCEADPWAEAAEAVQLRDMRSTPVPRSVQPFVETLLDVGLYDRIMLLGGRGDALKCLLSDPLQARRTIAQSGKPQLLSLRAGQQRLHHVQV